MTIGWIKLHRLLLEKEIFQDAYVLKVFVYLMLKAAYKDMKFKVGNKNIELAPGQLLYGRKVVSEKLGMGEGKLRNIMKYLVENGSIEMESHNKYSVVTIRNWEQYQRGEAEPDFPFDVDFLDDDDAADDYEEDFEYHLEQYAETEPAKNQVQIPTQTDFQNYENDFLANREPQYNNINKYKNNNKITKNKTRENNNKTKENNNIQNIQNIENPKNISYRQSDDTVYGCDVVERVAGLDLSQEMLLSDGAVISKGQVGCEDITNRSDADFQAEAFTALAEMDDAALDAYFESCAFADFDAADENHACDIYDDVYDCDDFTPDPAEVDYVEAHKLFNELWNQYPVQVGKEKVTDAQIMRLYEIGKKKMKHAILNYKGKKHRVPKQYWMNGSTFFNGGYEKYL